MECCVRLTCPVRLSGCVRLTWKPIGTGSHWAGGGSAVPQGEWRGQDGGDEAVPGGDDDEAAEGRHRREGEYRQKGEDPTQGRAAIPGFLNLHSEAAPGQNTWRMTPFCPIPEVQGEGV